MLFFSPLLRTKPLFFYAIVWSPAFNLTPFAFFEEASWFHPANSTPLSFRLNPHIVDTLLYLSRTGGSFALPKLHQWYLLALHCDFLTYIIQAMCCLIMYVTLKIKNRSSHIIKVKHITLIPSRKHLLFILLLLSTPHHVREQSLWSPFLIEYKAFTMRLLYLHPRLVYENNLSLPNWIQGSTVFISTSFSSRVV